MTSPGSRASTRSRSGTHNEFFQFYNLFIQNLYGNYEFSSVANLQAGHRAVVLAQLLEHVRSAAAGAVLGAAVRRLRRRSMAGAVQLHADLRRTVRRAALSGHAARESGVGHRLRPAHRRRAGAEDVVSPRVGLQLGSEQRRRQALADPRRHRLVRGPDACTSGCRTSTATPASTSPRSRPSFSTTNKIPFVANPNASR